MLQTRAGKRTAAAAMKIAVDMVHAGIVDERTAVLRVAPSQLDQLLHPTLDPNAPKERIARGLPASPGAVTGKVVFSAEDAETAAHDGQKVILVRIETSPDDINGMHAAQGILTARGGASSHAALVSRGMGKCAVVGCEALEVDYERQQFGVRGSRPSFPPATGSPLKVRLVKSFVVRCQHEIPIPTHLSSRSLWAGQIAFVVYECALMPTPHMTHRWLVPLGQKELDSSHRAHVL